MMLADIVKEEIGKQCIENNNIRRNQSVKITVVEQMCDVAIILNLVKYIEKQSTLKDRPFDSLSLIMDAIFLC